MKGQTSIPAVNGEPDLTPIQVEADQYPDHAFAAALEADPPEYDFWLETIGNPQHLETLFQDEPLTSRTFRLSQAGVDSFRSLARDPEKLRDVAILISEVLQSSQDGDTLEPQLGIETMARFTKAVDQPSRTCVFEMLLSIGLSAEERLGEDRKIWAKPFYRNLLLLLGMRRYSESLNALFFSGAICFDWSQDLIPYIALSRASQSVQIAMRRSPELGEEVTGILESATADGIPLEREIWDSLYNNYSTGSYWFIAELAMMSIATNMPELKNEALERVVGRNPQLAAIMLNFFCNKNRDRLHIKRVAVSATNLLRFVLESFTDQQLDEVFEIESIRKAVPGNYQDKSIHTIVEISRGDWNTIHTWSELREQVSMKPKEQPPFMSV